VQEIELDRIDRKILVHLQKHGRASNVELSEVANLSAPQCYRRHKRLEEQGAIVGYEARLNAARLGYGVVAFINVTMEKGHIRDLPKFKTLVTGLPEILDCYAVTGDFDYVLKVIARDLQSLSRFLMDTLMRLPGVTAVRSSVCLDEIKCTLELPLGS
jgi:DNA-binding Lrp family transcriptional regulator